MTPVITAFERVPPFAQGLVRDLRARWALEECGQAYQVRLLGQGEHKQPAHRRLQPFGQVPTYEDGEIALFESAAIVLHIARTFGCLLPAAAAARAKTEQWVFAALNSIEPEVMDLSIVDVFEKDEPWSAPRRPAVVKRLRDKLDALAHALDEADHLVDGAFTAADLLMTTVLRQLRSTDILDTYPALCAYQARCEARPAFATALAAQTAVFEANAPRAA